jgi:hypothetical protein
MRDSHDDSVTGYLAEYAFLSEAIRDAQRERHGFLGFSLAASGLILGLLLRSRPPRTASEACFLVALTGVVTLIAERLTIRSTQGVVRAGTYLRLFIEPHVEGLNYHRRNDLFLSRAKGTASARRGFAFAYLALTAGIVFAWFALPVQGDRQWWQTFLVVGLVVASLVQVGRLAVWGHPFGWADNTWVNDMWRDIQDKEQQAAKHDADERP